MFQLVPARTPRACFRAELFMTGRRLSLLVLAAIAGCAWQGPSLAGYPGLQQRVISFYDARAMEENALCPQPRMTSIVRTNVVEETPQRVVMNLGYHYRDETMTADAGGPGGGTKYGCDGFGERTFTFARTGRGGLAVEAMTGAQRQR
jgi:hypothetical protein